MYDQLNLMINSLKNESKNKNALLLLDIQERIINPIPNKDLIIKNIKKTLNAYQILEKNIYLSEQNPEKLGKTINEVVPKGEFKKIQKMDFSLAKSKNLCKELNKKKVTNLMICGFETHICIQQSTLEFINMGFKVFLVSDAMGSRNNLDHEISLQRMILNGAIITTTEALIFELCKTSDRREFKEISLIIKN